MRFRILFTSNSKQNSFEKQINRTKITIRKILRMAGIMFYLIKAWEKVIYSWFTRFPWNFFWYCRECDFSTEHNDNIKNKLQKCSGIIFEVKLVQISEAAGNGAEYWIFSWYDFAVKFRELKLYNVRMVSS